MRNLSFVRHKEHPEWGLGLVRNQAVHKETGEMGVLVYFPENLEQRLVGALTSELTLVLPKTPDLILQYHTAHTRRLGFEAKPLIPPQPFSKFPYRSGCRICSNPVEKATDFTCPHCAALICSNCGTCLCLSLPD